MRNVYKSNLQDIDFLLWDVLDLKNYLNLDDESKALIDRILEQAHKFAYTRLGTLYQSSDVQGCRLENGQVALPGGFAELWKEYVNNGWGLLNLPVEEGGYGQPIATTIAIQEMFYGANPAFMTLSGFGLPLFYLLKQYATSQMQNTFCEPLITNRWTACLCMTEPQAGTDVGNIYTQAIPLGEGKYAIQGNKIFISAGSHELSENIIYVVLARIAGAPKGTMGLSVFLVPRKDIETHADNGVHCARLENKMGQRGCPTAELTFGETARCTGYLLGEQPNRGMLQILSMMNHARMTTGIFALGMASSAYLNAAEYASTRLQGVDFKQMFNNKAERVPIIRHADVRRMLLDMKTTVEGCRALIYLLAKYMSKSQMLLAMGGDKADISRYDSLVGLLTPVVKSYVSDAAWEVAELAIQVHGGYGYLKDYPVEQYARDIKILSIWEGTNYIQAADIIRDKLSFGKNRKPIITLFEQINDWLETHDQPIVQLLRSDLETGMHCLNTVLDKVVDLIHKKEVELVLLNANNILSILANIVLAWLALKSAAAAQIQLNTHCSEPKRLFYEGKVLGAQYVFSHHLPRIYHYAQLIQSEASSPLMSEQVILADVEAAQDYMAFN